MIFSEFATSFPLGWAMYTSVHHHSSVMNQTLPDRVTSPRTGNAMTPYDVPSVIEVEVDGPVRVVRLNRPDQLNATNHELHKALADLFPQIDADTGARAVVLTGNGRAFLGRR